MATNFGAGAGELSVENRFRVYKDDPPTKEDQTQ